ncbi:MAG: iron-sulfur cluster assembly scaffold protein [Geminicoccaceae bacterium]|nr:MAG: iron-sulfur cluster assembly scaffold protein [Geminicoccaceae bacterium]
MSADLYDDAIKALAQASRGQGRLEAPDVTVTVDNPLCGDRITLDLALDGDHVSATGHQVRGCLLCEAGAALLDRLAPGKNAAELAPLPGRIQSYLKDPAAAPPIPGLEPFAPARAFRSRHRCITLPFEALRKALAERAT